MKPDTELLYMFKNWMKERQTIYLLKEEGRPKPWTKDKILQSYKFTNVFRQQDRVTKELNARQKDEPYMLTIWRVIVFRMFNHPATYDLLNEHGLIENWNTPKAKRLLHRAKKKGQQIFTGAYIITNQGSSRPKIDLVCESLGRIYQQREFIADSFKRINRVQHAVNFLTEFPMIGKFVAYEIATDLRHTKVLNRALDIYSWANPGPGAQRGLNRIYRGHKRKGASQDQYIAEMSELMSIANAQLAGKGVFKGHKFEMRDIEHSLCEFDKYMRVYNDEGTPRSRYNGTKD